MIPFVLHVGGQITQSGTCQDEDAVASLAVNSGCEYVIGEGASHTHYVVDGEIVPYTKEETDRLISATGCGLNWSVALKQWVDTRPPSLKSTMLASAIYDALLSVDDSAGRARLRYITSVPGQAETYAKKEQQARSWAAESFAGAAPSFIAAEAQALNVSAQSVALEVIGLADYWSNIKGPQIEATRRKWKVAIEAASDPSLIQGLVDAARAELDAL